LPIFITDHTLPRSNPDVAFLVLHDVARKTARTLLRDRVGRLNEVGIHHGHGSPQSHGALLAVWIIKGQGISVGVCDHPRVTQVCSYLAVLPGLELAVRLALPVFIEPINLPKTSAV